MTLTRKELFFFFLVKRGKGEAQVIFLQSEVIPSGDSFGEGKGREGEPGASADDQGPRKPTSSPRPAPHGHGRPSWALTDEHFRQRLRGSPQLNQAENPHVSMPLAQHYS